MKKQFRQGRTRGIVDIETRIMRGSRWHTRRNDAHGKGPTSVPVNELERPH